MFRLRKTKATPPPATLINQLQQFQTSTSGAHDFSSLENTPGIRGIMHSIIFCRSTSSEKSNCGRSSCEFS